MRTRTVLLTMGKVQATQLGPAVMFTAVDQETNATYLRLTLTAEQFGRLLLGELRMEVEAVVQEAPNA